MNSSAIRSSSPVVVPGRTCSPSSAIVSATISPARAICSSSWVDFRTITGSRPGNYLLERVLHLGEDPVHGLVRVHTDKIALRAVVLDERLGLLVVQGETAVDCLGRVVRAPLGRGAPLQALPGDGVRQLE